MQTLAPSFFARFDRVRSRVLARVARLPHGHAARARLFFLAGSSRGVATVAELRSILALTR
jgi:hypothetical protein